MRKLARVLVVALCVALAVSAAGCKLPKSKAKKKVSTAADTSVQGDVTAYTSMPQDQADKYLAVFKKEYPNVNVTIVSDKPAAIAAKLVKEKKAPVADVVWHTPLSAVTAAEEASALASYSYHPGQIDAVDANWTDGDHPDAPLFTGVDASLLSWAVNSSKTGGNSPATFRDLIDSKYSGMIAAPSINTDAGYTMVASLLSNMDETDGWKYLDQLDKNVTYYSDDQAAPAKDAAGGTVGIGIGFDNAVVAAANSGSGVSAVFPGQPEMSPYDIDVDVEAAQQHVTRGVDDCKDVPRLGDR